MSLDSVFVFDLDDTLFLERDYVRSGFRAVGNWVLEQTGERAFESTAWSLFEHGRRGDIFDETLRRLGLHTLAGSVAEMVRIYREHRPDIRMEPDAAACVHDLARAGTVLALITDGAAVAQRAKVSALALDGLMKTIIYTEELGPGHQKPDLLAFRMVQALYPAARCCYIADNPRKDFAGPLQLGWKTVRIRRRGGLHWAISADAGSGAHAEIESLDLLFEAISGDPFLLPSSKALPGAPA